MSPRTSVSRRQLSLARLAKMYDVVGSRVVESSHRASRMAALAQCDATTIIAVASELNYATKEEDPKFTGAQAAAIIRKLRDAEEAG